MTASDSDDQLVQARNVAEFADEVNNANEWVKARALVGGHPFNIIAASERSNTYKNKTTQEFVFEIQWTAGDMRGARANMSLTVDQSRARIVAALRKHGPHGPYWMTKVKAKASDNVYYKMVTNDPALAGDDFEDFPGGLEEGEEDLPF